MTKPDERRAVLGLEVALTGRLASMTHAEARRRIELAGGTVASVPRAGTALVVVGQGGPPLEDDGRPTHALVRARELQEQGARLAVVDEDELLARLGLEEERAGLARDFTAGQLARMLDVPIAEIRAWVRAGLITPARARGRLLFFTFQKVASAKALVALRRAGVGAARIRRSLAELRERAGDDAGRRDAEQMLGQLEVLEIGGPLFLRTEEGALAEPNGQLHFAFDAPPETRLRRLSAEPDKSLEEWFELGVRAERDGRIEDAVRAYRSALARDERHPELWFNLGNALYALGCFDEALERYRGAVELAPDYVEAWNNLGILLGEIDRPVEAISAYRRALSLAPDYPDALYNLAETLVARGELAEARRLWRAYLVVDPQSPFARIVRERLARL